MKSGVLTFVLILASGLADEVKLNKIKAIPQRFEMEWDREFCKKWEDEDVFSHPDTCQMFMICWGGELWEMECPDGLYFDMFDLVCDERENVICYEDLEENPPEPTPTPGPTPTIRPPPTQQPPQDDDRCPPPGSTEVRFLPSKFCDSFYICINGNPIEQRCAPGQHWNARRQFCDTPGNAQCDTSASRPLPDCPINFVGQVPHPHNCNWFIHCSRGNRSIQQCQHLHHFDVDQNRCLFKRIARCVKY